MRWAITSIVVLSLFPTLTAAEPKKDQPAKNPVQLAIKAGQRYLQNLYKPGGPAEHSRELLDNLHVVGRAALAGLALIESGLDETDPSVHNIANGIRRSALSTTSTYEVSLIIMFLDRLGSSSDRPLIQFMTLRLLSGQSPDGVWSYTCNLPLDDQEMRKLQAIFVHETRLKTPRGGKPSLENTKKTDDTELKDLHPELKKYAKLVNTPQGGGGDHSNTQFATVALWCARRHHVDVTQAMVRIGKHYRDNQGADGGWDYTGTRTGSTPAMTCAGLLGLAMSAASDSTLKTDSKEKGKPLNLNQDKAVVAGLKCLGEFVASDTTGIHATNLYFLWSLERVGMALGLQTIGKIDWYKWGCFALLKTIDQGTWTSSQYPGAAADINTSFALLFLCRANLASDLTDSLKGQITDPGASKLVSGGGREIGRENPFPPPQASSSTNPSASLNKPLPSPNIPKPTPILEDEFEKKAKQLTSALLKATSKDQAALIEAYRQTKGAEYTEALARCAVQLQGTGQELVREALAQRLTRMTVATLIRFLKDANVEVRRGAAVACGIKKDKQFIPELIQTLADTDASVVQASRTSLKILSSQDFGPALTASAAEQIQSLWDWQAWWDRQKK
jgi:hypothetical protein